jgi:hypothetical protein
MTNPNWTLIYTSPRFYYWKHTTTGRLDLTTTNKPPESGEGGYYNLLTLAIVHNEPYETLKDIQINPKYKTLKDD